MFLAYFALKMSFKIVEGGEWKQQFFRRLDDDFDKFDKFNGNKVKENYAQAEC